MSLRPADAPRERRVPASGTGLLPTTTTLAPTGKRFRRAGRLGSGAPFRLSRAVRYAGLILVAGLGLGAISTSRSNLALVVSACRANMLVTASPLPCLAVHAPRDERNGYAVLREPAHRERTILSPLADLSGIEDPRLLSPGTPNFFAPAWNERRRLLDHEAAIELRRDVALALNSRDNRSQDHLHIHIACIRPGVRRILEDHLAAIPWYRFARMKVRMRHRTYWATRIEADDLERFDPIRFVAANFPEARADMGRLAIVVVGAEWSDARRGFYLLVGDYDRRRNAPPSTERLLDPTCSPAGG